MYVQIKNENYGYDVTTYGEYVVIGNPAITRYDSLIPGEYHTGSIDYFRYNKTTDQHDYIGTFYKPYISQSVLLITEDANTGSTGPNYNIDTESELDIEIDKNNYTASIEDGFGLSLDMYNKFLIAGTPYYTQLISTYTASYTSSGVFVSIYNMEFTEFNSPSSSALIYNINDPDISLPTGITGSFGWSVSINNDWVAIGSPLISGSNGMVYMFQNKSTGSNYQWQLYQKLQASGSIAESQFGTSLKLNKASGSYSHSIVIGAGNSANSQAYYFEFISGSWNQTFTFLPSYATQSMVFANYLPYQLTMSNANGFGTSVSTYADSVIIGERSDRSYYEYSGSLSKQQGSVYIFEKCVNTSYLNPPPTVFKQVLKTYGNSNTLNNNYLGFSVDIWGNNAVVGSPKLNVFSLTSCYVGGTLEQLHYCDSDLETILNGQSIFLQKNTSSCQWEITNVYQKKKKFLSPYRSYGFGVAIADQSMVIGSPLYLEDFNRQLNISVTQSADVSLDDISGKGYIYNLSNLRPSFHVGNVFYRNGKVVIMTSGSAFNELFFNPISTYTYEYDLEYQSRHSIFEKQIICTINPGEFNVSTNPTSLISKSSSFDINGNGEFDFQDADIILRYMQYKNTSLFGSVISTDWSSSILKTNDELSFYNWSFSKWNSNDTGIYTSASITEWETIDTSMQTTLDLNQDNKIDILDMNIMWKYFSKRLNQNNYKLYITPACNRKLFSDEIDYLDSTSLRTSLPQINPLFLNYEFETSLDNTGSFLSPMVTTIGLYSGLDLVCVAKLGNPIKITPELPINFVVKMDF